MVKMPNARSVIKFATSKGGKSVLALAVIIGFIVVVSLTKGPGEKVTDDGGIYVNEHKEIKVEKKIDPYDPAANPQADLPVQTEPKVDEEDRKIREILDNLQVRRTQGRGPLELPPDATETPAAPGGAGSPKSPGLHLTDEQIDDFIRQQGHTGPIDQKKRDEARAEIQRRIQARAGALPSPQGSSSPGTPGSGASAGAQQEQPATPLPINLYTAPFNSKQSMISDRFAPFGRLVKCELVITVDSAKINTPVVALVVEDVWHDGTLIIPAGVEAHGTASKASMRDRIEASGTWTFVWRTNDDDNGKELNVSGLALNYTKHPREEKWDITDGSAGLKGYVIDNTDWADLIAIAAVFLSGVGEGMFTQTTTVTGSTSTISSGGTNKDAIGKGLQNAANLYAQRMLEAINRDGAFVRVPAGTMFYLYVQDTIDMNKAQIGGSIVADGFKQVK
jgi:hypothetical protein